MRTPSILVCVLFGCGAASSPSEAPVQTPLQGPAPTIARPATSSWADATRSPWPAAPVDERVAALTAACGTADGSLARVAAKLVAERARGLGAPDPDRVVSLLRAQGEPHVRPRIVSASSRGPSDDAALRAQLEAAKKPATRCGVALARPDHEAGKEGNELFVGVVVDAHADLDALPMRARTGEWLTFSANLHVPASSAKLVVLGPRGAPRTVPTSIDRSSGLVRARFALDRPGAFVVQLVGDLASGPEPLLEARVFTDVEPPATEDNVTPAPGEELATPGDHDDDVLTRMIAALRTSETLPPLARDPRLDELARAHANAMRRARVVAHDLGDGDPTRRFEDASLVAKNVGENVARARSVALAHRALHASPSHRMNLLRAEYTHVGVAVVRDDNGDVWACEVFASNLR